MDQLFGNQEKDGQKGRNQSFDILGTFASMPSLPKKTNKQEKDEKK